MNVLSRKQNITSAVRTVRKYFAIHLLMFSSAEKITMFPHLDSPHTFCTTRYFCNKVALFHKWFKFGSSILNSAFSTKALK